MLDDLLKEWDERAAKAQSLYASFKETYGQVAGVMEISDDNWFGDTFVVGYDSETYVEGSIPREFQGILVQFYSVYDSLKSYEELIDKVEAISPGDLHHSQFDFFYKNVRRLKTLIEEYENPK